MLFRQCRSDIRASIVLVASLTLREKNTAHSHKDSIFFIAAFGFSVIFHISKFYYNCNVLGVFGTLLCEGKKLICSPALVLRGSF